MTAVIFAGDFESLGILAIAVPALAVALAMGLIGVLKRRRWLILAASAVSLSSTLFLFWLVQSMRLDDLHSAGEVAELQFFATTAAGMAALTLLGLLLPRD